MVAEVIALVCGAPELTGDWIDCLTDAVADAEGVVRNELAFRGVLENVGAEPGELREKSRPRRPGR